MNSTTTKNNDGLVYLAVSDDRATATLALPGLPGYVATRSGANADDSLANTLRSLLEMIESREGQARMPLGDVPTEYIRVSVEMDVPVRTAAWNRCCLLDAPAESGNKEAQEERTNLILGWLTAALYRVAKPRHRDVVETPEFMSVDWCTVDEAEDWPSD
jgi:hypothetical protein